MNKIQIFILSLVAVVALAYLDFVTIHGYNTLADYIIVCGAEMFTFWCGYYFHKNSEARKK